MGVKDIEDYDVCVCGNDIVNIVLAAEKYSALILQRSGLKLKRKESGFGTMNRIIIKNVDSKTETYSSSG